MGFMLWVLSQRPDIMQRLRDEVDQSMPDSRTPPDIETLQDLPYLNAFIKEGECRPTIGVPNLT